MREAPTTRMSNSLDLLYDYYLLWAASHPSQIKSGKVRISIEVCPFRCFHKAGLILIRCFSGTNLGAAIEADHSVLRTPLPLLFSNGTYGSWQWASLVVRKSTFSLDDKVILHEIPIPYILGPCQDTQERNGHRSALEVGIV